MTHLHKLPKYRNPFTKARAVVSRVYGTDATYFIDLFEFRKQTSFATLTVKGWAEAKVKLESIGYTKHIEG